MRVLVAGGTGLLGRASVTALREAGHDVVVVSRSARARAGVDVVQADVGAGPLDPQVVGRVDAIVNLVGIASEAGDSQNTFARAHVEAVEHLVAFARAASVRRFVHISVVQVAAARGPYHETKVEGEARVRACDDLDWTILRPGLVYGEGDDMMSNVVGFVRMAPVFPVPGGSPGPLQVVDVRDVADAVVRTLAHDAAVGRTYDVVGPQRMTLSDLVAKVARALGLPTWTPRVPVAAMRLAARLSEAVLGRGSPVTTTQLGMLVAGLFGDPEPARRDLGLDTRPLTDARIRELAEGIDAPLPSVRLAPTPAHDALLARGREASRWLPLLPLVLVLIASAAVGPMGGGGITQWAALLGAYVVADACALSSKALPWSDLLRPRASHVAIGLAVAGVMLAGALAVLPLLRALAPEFAAPVSSIYGWAADASPLALAIFVAIVIGEDVAWRGAATLVLGGRWGPVLGVLGAGVLFALAHVLMGPPVLWLAALLAGTAWAAVGVRTRSLVPVVVAHLTWDAAMLWVSP